MFGIVLSPEFFWEINHLIFKIILYININYFINQLIFNEIIIFLLSRLKIEDVKEEGKKGHAENIHQKKNKIQEKRLMKFDKN